MLYALIYILLICGAVYLVLWALGQLGTPAPLANIVRVMVIVIAIIFVVAIVLGLFGVPTGINAPPLVK